MTKDVETYKFKKGQVLHLDDIYLIQGLADGKWWTASDPHDDEASDRGEIVTIVEDITIKIIVTRKGNKDEED